jgi:hypothetical protein
VDVEKLSPSCVVVSHVEIIKRCAECFPALNFCENLPPKKQMVPKMQGKIELLSWSDKGKLRFVKGGMSSADDGSCMRKMKSASTA